MASTTLTDAEFNDALADEFVSDEAKAAFEAKLVEDNTTKRTKKQADYSQLLTSLSHKLIQELQAKRYSFMDLSHNDTAMLLNYIKSKL